MERVPFNPGVYQYPNSPMIIQERVIYEEPDYQYGNFLAPEVHKEQRFVEFDDQYGNSYKHHNPTTGYGREYQAPEVHKKLQFLDLNDQYGNRYKHRSPAGYGREYQAPEVHKKVSFSEFENQYEGNRHTHGHNPSGYRHHKYQAPEVHTKVQLDRSIEVNRNGKSEVIEEKVDVEADNFIQRRHKNFDLSKMNSTFKVY